MLSMSYFIRNLDTRLLNTCEDSADPVYFIAISLLFSLFSFYLKLTKFWFTVLTSVSFRPSCLRYLRTVYTLI